MAAIPYQTGFSPRLWQHGINCMLEKKKGNFRVDKLRAILLYEAEFNQVNKILGRDCMFFAEDLKAVAQEQYGSRRQQSAVNQGLNKTLALDVLRQLKQAGAVCVNDAKSCYDRIVHNIASLSLQRVGVPLEPIICMFTTIENLEHRIKTIYGTSELGFCGKLWVRPIQGVGQGNGAGPQIWALVSTPVLNMLRELGYCAFFRACLDGEELRFVGYSFVDDTDLITTMDLELTYADVATKMQSSIDAWEGGIRATGGAIVPHKSFWVLVDFKWKAGRWRYATIKETPATLSVLDLDGRRQTLRRLRVDEAERTLGVYIAPDGNMTEQARRLRRKAEEWAEHTRTGILPRHLAWESFKTTITRTLAFPLAATTLSAEECRHIMAPAKRVALSCSGVACTIANPVACGPTSHLGLGVPALYIHQGVEHCTRLLSLVHCPHHLTRALSRPSLPLL